MNFNTNKNKYDSVVPPKKFFDKEKINDVKDQRKSIWRSLGVMVVSFASVFVLTFVAVTWPMIPQQVTYLVKDALYGDKHQALASVEPVTFNENLDSDGDGFTDQQEIAAGYDPYNPQPVKLDSDGDGIRDDVEINYYGTDPNKVDTDNDGHDDLTEILHGYSPLQPANFDKWVAARTSATLTIPEIDAKLPVVWNENVDQIKDDLEKGVVKYNGTANPGEGNTVIVAHSSDYAWNNNKYADAFSLIDRLKEGDPIYLDYAGSRYTYRTLSQTITDPSDTSFFAETPNKMLTLGTCWPVFFSFNRLYLRAELTDISPLK